MLLLYGKSRDTVWVRRKVASSYTSYSAFNIHIIYIFFIGHGPMQVWTRAVLLDRTSMLPVKLRCRFAIRYLQYAVDRQVLVYRHPILQEKTTPRYSQLAITHRTHSPMLQKVSKNLNQKKNWSLDSPSTSILFCILFPHVHGIINLLNTACNKYFASIL